MSKNTYCENKRHYPIKDRSCNSSDLFLSAGNILECGNCGARFDNTKEVE